MPIMQKGSRNDGSEGDTIVGNCEGGGGEAAAAHVARDQHAQGQPNMEAPAKHGSSGNSGTDSEGSGSICSSSTVPAKQAGHDERQRGSEHAAGARGVREEGKKSLLGKRPEPEAGSSSGDSGTVDMKVCAVCSVVKLLLRFSSELWSHPGRAPAD